VEVAEARRALGLGPTPAWDDVRAAYRQAIRAAHPDRAGGSTQRAAVLNDAYATLLRAREAGTLHAVGAAAARTAARPAPAPPPAAAPMPDPVPGAVIAAGDTLVLPVPSDEAFVAVLEACHRVGDVTYVDRQCAIVEAVLRLPGEGTCSLVVTFQGRAHGTDAFCTLEAIEHVHSLPVESLVQELGSVVTDVLGGR
jgi:hypothetical protein